MLPCICWYGGFRSIFISAHFFMRAVVLIVRPADTFQSAGCTSCSFAHLSRGSDPTEPRKCWTRGSQEDEEDSNQECPCLRVGGCRVRKAVRVRDGWGQFSTVPLNTAAVPHPFPLTKTSQKNKKTSTSSQMAPSSRKHQVLAHVARPPHQLGRDVEYEQGPPAARAKAMMKMSAGRSGIWTGGCRTLS
jgi:hypothetical protein